MEYFHKRHISHRDIKLENTLLKVRASKQHPSQATVGALTDFRALGFE
jgi:serine/threonine protein kinase